jgi:hypothetical protein
MKNEERIKTFIAYFIMIVLVVITQKVVSMFLNPKEAIFRIFVFINSLF